MIPCPMCGQLFATWKEMDVHAQKEADEAMKLVEQVFGKDLGK